ncbi:MAG TPA: DUF2092 domain-containing protein [Sphingobium sp.]|uniref:DUF2092 domain-containing protein n=1 Tax=Sphingobium sp. TaxID=1912891 RepID=UPI002ED07428
MRHIVSIVTTVGSLSLGLFVAGTGEALAKETHSPTVQATAPNAISPEIRKALDRMANQLKSLTSLELRADMTTEDVLDNGQKLQHSGVVTIDARKPDRFFISVDSAQRTRRFYYDGKQVAVYAPTTGYYAMIPAPPTTRQVLDDLANRLDVETPLADLLQWGAAGVHTEGIKSALYAGPDRVGGQECDHYAFRQPGADWQLWIRKGDTPLPCKLVIVNTDDPAQPQTTTVFNWTPNQQFTESTFTFTPPAKAMRIQLGQANTAAGKGSRP